MAQEFSKKFYKSKEWTQFRTQIILDRTIDGEIRCEKCGRVIAESKQIHIHHKTELTPENINDRMITLNPENVQVICKRCHDEEHNRFCKGASHRKEKAVYIVYGPPMGGKTTYVRNNMQPGDIVVDMDALYSAVSMMPMYDKPDGLKYNVLSIRNLMIDNIKTRYGNFRTAWIIGGYANKVDRERLVNELGAELVFIDSSKEECYYKLKYCNDYRQSHQEEWKKYIDEWFETFRE